MLVSIEFQKLVSKYLFTHCVVIGVCWPFLGTVLQVRQSRDPEAAKRCLAAIEECARTREGNLLGLAVEAARARWATQHFSTQHFPSVAFDVLIF